MRAILNDQPPITFNYATDDVDLVDDFAVALQNRNIFFGVATRANGKGRSLKDCAKLHARFADLDFKTSSEPKCGTASRRFRFRRV